MASIIRHIDMITTVNAPASGISGMLSSFFIVYCFSALGRRSYALAAL